MKKKILFIAALAIMAIGFTSCEKQSLGKTQITYYADIQLKGGSQVVVNKGTEYVEPGYTATMAGQDVTSQVAVSGSVDTSTSGVYTLYYSMSNKDGFTSSVSRTVIVLDLTDAVEGFWACTPTSFRTNTNTGAAVAYGESFEILIIGEGDGVYLVDDLLAGWYAQRAGYGTDYAMEAEISIAPDGSITLLDSYVPGWSDAADALSADAKYDAAAKTITYTVTYAGYLDFTVTLNKVEL